VSDTVSELRIESSLITATVGGRQVTLSAQPIPAGDAFADLPEEERADFVQQLQEEYREDIDIYRLADELIVDAVVPPADLRDELVRRFAVYASRVRDDARRHHGNFPT